MMVLGRSSRRERGGKVYLATCRGGGRGEPCQVGGIIVLVQRLYMPLGKPAGQEAIGMIKSSVRFTASGTRSFTEWD